jgi:outer membrane protein assembly factor BamB
MAAGSCRSPTEIKVVVTTDFDCGDLNDVTVAVGTLGDALENAPPTSTSSSCSNHSVGTIVVVPSGSDHAEIGIKVVGGFAGKPAEDCAPATGSSPPDYGIGCIVARRALEFTPHTPLTVPIVLRASCNGIACGETQTCVEGQCVSASVPEPSACSGPAGCGECDLVDGGCAGLDAGVDAEGGASPPVFADCGDTSGLQAGAAWPMNNGCPTQVSRSPFVAQASPAMKWSFSTRGNQSIVSVPVIGADGTLYFGSNDGYAYALNPTTGAKKWEWHEPTASPIMGDFAIGADGTLVGTSTGAFGLVSASGALLWGPVAGVLGDVTMGGGELALSGSASGPLVALDVAHGGVQSWASAPLGGLAGGSPAVGPDGTIYVSANDDNVYAISATTHGITWKYALGASGSAPAYFGGTVYVDGATGLVALDASDGTLRWTQAATGGGCNVPVAPDGTVYAPYADTLKAFDSTGQLRWSVDTGGSVGSCLLIDGAGSILVVTGSQIAAYEPQDGHPLWTVAATSNGQVTVGADGTVFESTLDGHLLAFGH